VAHERVRAPWPMGCRRGGEGSDAEKVQHVLRLRLEQLELVAALDLLAVATAEGRTHGPRCLAQAAIFRWSLLEGTCWPSKLGCWCVHAC
jgi:hypothetical protein